jgi:DNA (cytosine-5)-methyltransferase 1
VIVLECVEELLDWGPLDDDDRIDKRRRGEYWDLWWRGLEHMGYSLELRIISACDHGAPTSRKRLYVVARCDGGEIGWPNVSHGPHGYEPYRTAAECIDYSEPCPSIFMSAMEAHSLYKQTGIKCKRPLVENTMRRIGTGLWKHVIDSQDPFIIPLTHCKPGSNEPDGSRTYDINEPFRTVTAANRGEMGFIAPVVSSFYGNGKAHDIRTPMRTATTRDRFGFIAPTLVQTSARATSTSTSRSGPSSRVAPAATASTDWSRRFSPRSSAPGLRVAGTARKTPPSRWARSRPATTTA